MKEPLLSEFYAKCDYLRKAALRLLNRPLRTTPAKRSGAKIIYDPVEVLPVLKTVWLASDPLCSKLFKVALPEGDYVNSLTFTELFSGWTENRAVWSKSGEAVLVQLNKLETIVPDPMKDFHTDNGGEFFNWTHVRQIFGHDRFEHPELVALMNDLYAQEWSQFTNHFKPTFKLVKREKRMGKPNTSMSRRRRPRINDCWRARKSPQRRRRSCEPNTPNWIPSP